MKEVVKYEMAIIMSANARFNVFFHDGTSKLFTINIEQLASYDSILRQPQVMFDPNNNVFVGRSRHETTDLKAF